MSLIARSSGRIELPREVPCQVGGGREKNHSTVVPDVIDENIAMANACLTSERRFRIQISPDVEDDDDVDDGDGGGEVVAPVGR